MAARSIIHQGKFNFLSIFAFLLLSSGVGSTHAGLILQDESGPGSWNVVYYPTAQTFTAEDARIREAAIYVDNENREFGREVECALYSGTRTNSPPLKVATRQLPPFFKGYLAFAFSEVELTVGAKYRLEIRPRGEGLEIMVQGSGNGSSYTGGDLMSGDNTITNNDLRFRIIPLDAAISTIGITPQRVEVPEESGPAVVTVNRAGDLEHTAAVEFRTATQDFQGAVPGIQFVSASGTLTFAPGETQKNISVTLINDEVYRTNNIFRVELTSGGPQTLLDNSLGRVVIADDDLVFINFVTNSMEVSERSGLVQIPVERTEKLNLSAEALYVFNGTAVLGEDYSATQGGVIQFAPGETLKHIPLNIAGDGWVEGSEWIYVTLAPLGGASSEQNYLTLELKDSSSRIEFAPSAGTVMEGNTSMPLTLERTGDLSTDLTFSFETVNGTALAGSDYLGRAGLMTIPQGMNNAVIEIPIFGDLIQEPSETFQVRLFSTNSQNSLSFGTNVTVTILNNSAVVQFASTNVNVFEDAGTANIVVRRTGLVDIPATALFMTSQDTATAGADFTPQSGTLNFAAGETEKIIQVGLINNTVPEVTESFFVTLTGASENLTMTNEVATVFINDDAAVVAFARTNVVSLEDGQSVKLTLSRSGNLDQAFSVDYATENGTATAGNHYVAGIGTVSFAAGETNKSIIISLLENELTEGDLTFQVFLGNPIGEVHIGSSNRVFVSIGDDDQVVSFSSPEYTGYLGSDYVELVLTRGNTKLAPLRVRYSTVDGTAEAGMDYVETHGEVEFLPGQEAVWIEIPLLERDPAAVGIEFSVQIDEVVGGTAGNPDTAEVLILGSGVLAIDYTYPLSGVRFLGVQPSRQLVVITNNAIARLNADGSIDSSYAGASVSHNSASMQRDGSVVFGTVVFDSEINQSIYHVQRLTPGGMIDTTFSEIKTGLNGFWVGVNDEIFLWEPGLKRATKDGVRDPSFLIELPQAPVNVTADSENYVYVAIRGQPLKRYLPNGTLDRVVLDESYGFALIRKIADDGKLYVQASKIDNRGPWMVRLNPDLSIDPTWKEAQGVTGPVSILPDGRVLAVRSQLTEITDFSQGVLALMLPDGNIDQSFGQTIRGNIHSSVDFGTEIYISGGNLVNDSEPLSNAFRLSIVAPDTIYFSRDENRSYNDQPYARAVLKRGGSLVGSAVARVTTENDSAQAGVHFTAMDEVVTFGPGEDTKEIRVPLLAGAAGQSGSFKLNASGDAVLPNKRPSTEILLQNVPAGEFVLDFGFPAEFTAEGSFFSYPLRGVAVQPQRGIVVSAGKPGVGDVLKRYKFSGEIDPTFDSSSFHPTNSIRRVMIVHDRIFTSGEHADEFTAYRSDGTLDTEFVSPFAFTSSPAVAEAPDGDIYVAGRTTYPTITVARLNADGSIDAAFAPAMISTGDWSPPSDIVVQSDGKVLVSGPWLKRFWPDGSIDTTFRDLNPNAYISDLALQPDGKILVGGGFSTIDGKTTPGLVRLNSDGTADESFDLPFIALRWVYSVVPLEDGTILIGGSFGQALMRLTGTGSRIFTFTSLPINGAINQIAIQDSENIIIAGDFTFSGAEQGLARLTTRDTPQPRLNIQATGSGFPLTMDYTAGTMVEFDWSQDLTNWTTFLQTNLNGTNGPITLPVEPEASFRFYRARQY